MREREERERGKREREGRERERERGEREESERERKREKYRHKNLLLWDPYLLINKILHHVLVPEKIIVRSPPQRQGGVVRRVALTLQGTGQVGFAGVIKRVGVVEHLAEFVQHPAFIPVAVSPVPSYPTLG